MSLKKSLKVCQQVNIKEKNESNWLDSVVTRLVLVSSTMCSVLTGVILSATSALTWTAQFLQSDRIKEDNHKAWNKVMQTCHIVTGDAQV